jgi:FkbM family methyltransferase
MKWKSWLWTLGVRPAAKVYGSRKVSFALEQDGYLEFEQWLHPKDYFRPFPQSLIDTLRRYIQPGDSVIDIGAHCGDFTVPLALAAGASGVVFAWEPNPYVYSILEKNARLNPSKTHIVPFHAAVAATDGELEFHYSDPGFCNGGAFEGISRWQHGHPFRLKVPGRRMTEWLTQRYPERMSRIRFVKVDTEGNELAVLQSIEPILKKQQPYLHVEMYRHLTAERRRELWGYLNGLGYDLHLTAEGHGVEPLQPIGEGDVMRWEHYDMMVIPRSLQQQPRLAA